MLPMIFSEKPVFTKQNTSQMNIQKTLPTPPSNIPHANTREPSTNTLPNTTTITYTSFLFKSTPKKIEDNIPVKEIEKKLLTKVLDVPKVSFQMFKSSYTSNSCCGGVK